MQNIERNNNFYSNTSPIISKNLTNSKNQDYSKNTFNYYPREKSPYSSNIQYNEYIENNRNINNIYHSNLNYNQTPLNQNKLSTSPNPIKNNYTLGYNQSISNSNSLNHPNYFSPLPKNNNENINFSNLNLKSNNKIQNSPLYNLKNNSHKKTLILDLDETLVHSGFHPFNRNSDFTLNINVDGKNHTIYVLKRPYVEEFLSEISPYFEIIIFTASISEYASPVIDLLDKENLTKGRLFREHCLFKHGLYLKDLKNIGKNLKDVVIIDNNPASYALNQDNGLPILTWYEDLNDKELINLIPLLKYLSTVEDIRPIIKIIVDKQKNIINFDIVEDLIKNKINENDNYKSFIYESNDNYKYININNQYDNNKNNTINLDRTNNYDYKNNNNKIRDINESNNENKYRNYLVNDNLYKYNNNIHDSLSNMSLNEIQNEGCINKNLNYNSNNKYSKDITYNDKYNNERNSEYYSYNNYNEKEKIFNKTN